ncbi:MAG: helix-turn-helix domain-containing protein [Pseudonocardiaceae bacterium]
MDVEEAVTIGQRLRRIRVARDKTQKVIADRAGISDGYLSLLESGKRPLDSLKLIKDLAYALEIAPSELTSIPIPAPGNGHTDSAVEAVRHALTAVDHGRPGGQVLPVEELRGRASRLQDMRRRCQFAEVADDLPGLIRDLHTSIAAGRDVANLLELVVSVHVHVTRQWLKDAGASLELRSRATALARDMAREHGEVIPLGVATFATARALLAGGMFDLARAELDSVTLPAVTPETVGLVGGLMVRHALVAEADKRPGDVAAPMEAAAELAQRFGETGDGDLLGFEFGPTEVALARMSLALEAGEPDRAISIAAGVQPQRLPSATRQAAYWVDFGRAAARLRGRRDDAVRAFLTAEDLFPVRVYRNPFARDAIAGLVERSRQDAVGRDLRRLAWRADLRV